MAASIEKNAKSKDGKNAHRLEASGRRLVDPIRLQWPPTETAVQAEIKTHLNRIFSKYSGCLRTIAKQPKGKTTKTTEKLTKEEEIMKKAFRSWFVMGHRSVMRHLERDNLRCLLVWTATSPSVLKQSLLLLAASHGSPAVLLDDLLQSVTDAWPGLTSLTCLGVLKAEEPNDFDDLVQYFNSIDSKLTFPEGSNLLHSVIPGSDTGHLSASSEMTTSQKPITKTTAAAPTCVDFQKYYIKKPCMETSKSFSGQDFISFGSTSHLEEADVVFKNGMIVRHTSPPPTAQIFGLRPPLTRRADQEKTVTSGSCKRKLNDNPDDKSMYVGINIKNLKYDNRKPKTKKGKKIKKKL